jgi:hypothetical protein
LNHGTERRVGGHRHLLGAAGALRARIRPGKDVVIIDISAGGALVESRHRLLPGAPVEITLDAGDRRATVRGRVARSFVARLRSTCVFYRTALAFDGSLPWFAADSTAYDVPTLDCRFGRRGAVAATQELV